MLYSPSLTVHNNAGTTTELVRDEQGAGRGGRVTHCTYYRTSSISDQGAAETDSAAAGVGLAVAATAAVDLVRAAEAEAEAATATVAMVAGAQAAVEKAERAEKGAAGAQEEALRCGPCCGCKQQGPVRVALSGTVAASARTFQRGSRTRC